MQPDITVVTVTDEIPAPTFATMPGIASMNSVYADHNCGEEDGRHHLEHKGGALDGIEGWEPEYSHTGEWWQADEETGEQL